MLNIRVERVATLKEKPDEDNLGFGRIFTDHMFVMNYTEGRAGTIQELFHTARFSLSLQRWCSIMPRRFLKG